METSDISIIILCNVYFTFFADWFETLVYLYFGIALVTGNNIFAIFIVKVSNDCKYVKLCRFNITEFIAKDLR